MSTDRIFKHYRKEHEVTKQVKISIDEATLATLLAIQEDFMSRFQKFPSLSHLANTVVTTFLSKLQPEEVRELYHEMTTRPLTQAQLREIYRPVRERLKALEKA